jgi:hypothetical protein
MPSERVLIPPGRVWLATGEVGVEGFCIDRRPVSRARYGEYLKAMKRDGPGGTRLDPVRVSPDEAQAFAAWAGGELPSEAQWQLAMCGFDEGGGFEQGSRSVFDLEGTGEWELTRTPHERGRVVRGGAWRDRPGEPARFAHRSWEVEAAADLVFRLVTPKTPQAPARWLPVGRLGDGPDERFTSAHFRRCVALQALHNEPRVRHLEPEGDDAWRFETASPGFYGLELSPRGARLEHSRHAPGPLSVRNFLRTWTELTGPAWQPAALPEFLAEVLRRFEPCRDDLT